MLSLFVVFVVLQVPDRRCLLMTLCKMRIGSDFVLEVYFKDLCVSENSLFEVVFSLIGWNICHQSWLLCESITSAKYLQIVYVRFESNPPIQMRNVLQKLFNKCDSLNCSCLKTAFVDLSSNL